MPLIRKQPKPIRKITLGIRLEEPLIKQLKRYAIYWDSEPAFIITERLQQLFDGDKKFHEWCATHPDLPEGQKTKREVKSHPSNGSLISGASAPAVSAIQAAR
jgi:hypothetical protein